MTSPTHRDTEPERSSADRAAGLRPLVYRFGPFEFRDWPARLRRNGAPVALQPQPARCLALLLRRAGEVVERREIRDHIWGEESHLEHDQGINYIVKKLRGALDDDPGDPSYIETVPRQGYRFLVPVKARPEPEAGRFPATGRKVALAAGLAGLGLAAVGLWLAGLWLAAGRPEVQEVDRAPALEPLEAWPITSAQGIERQPDLSPDGRRVAYSAWDDASSGWKVFVQQVEDGEPLRVTSGPGTDSRPRWMPDGERLAFGRVVDGGDCRLLTLWLLGGREREVGRCGRTAVPDVAVSPDGQVLVFGPPAADGSPAGLDLLSLATGEVRHLTDPGFEQLDSDPAVSPDGSRLAFLRGPRPNVRDVSTVPLAGGAARRLTHDDTNISGLAWSADGRFVVFSSNRVGLPALWRLPIDGGEIEWIPIRREILHDPTVSHGRVAFSAWEIESSLWKRNLAAAGQRTRPAYASEAWEGVPRHSPDGSRLAFASLRSGAAEVWLAAAGGRRARQLTSLGAELISWMDWSPDGAKLAVTAQSASRSRTWLVEVGFGRAEELRPGEAFELPTWSLDGEAIFFVSDRTGSPQIWRADLAASTVEQVTFAGADSGRETPAGLVVTSPTEEGLWLVEPGRGESERQTRLTAHGPEDGSLWGAAGLHLWYLDRTDGENTLVVLPAHGDQPERRVRLDVPRVAFSGLSSRLESDIYWAALP